MTGSDVGEALQKAGGADVILSTTNSAAQVSQAIAGPPARGAARQHGRARRDRSSSTATLLLMRQTQGRRLDAEPPGRPGRHARARRDGQDHGRPMETFPLDRVNDALAQLDAGKMRYRGVLLPR